MPNRSIKGYIVKGLAKFITDNKTFFTIHAVLRRHLVVENYPIGRISLTDKYFSFNYPVISTDNIKNEIIIAIDKVVIPKKTTKTCSIM